MNDIDERYSEECTLCCDQRESVDAEEQFQTLFEIVRDYESIPNGLIEKMDEPNKTARNMEQRRCRRSSGAYDSRCPQRHYVLFRNAVFIWLI